MLEAGIYASHIIWRIRYRKLRKEAKSTGKTIDELLALESTSSASTRTTSKTGDIEAGQGVFDRCTVQIPSGDVERSEKSENC